jgi:hypothetical protein
MSSQKPDRDPEIPGRAGAPDFSQLGIFPGRPPRPPPSVRYYCQIYRLNKEKGEGFSSPSLYPIFDLYSIKLYVLYKI